MKIKKKRKKRQAWAWRQSLRGVLFIQEEAGRERRTCSFLWQQQRANCRLHLPAQPPVCSWLGGSAAKSFFITPTASLRPLPLCHVHLLSTPLDNLGGFISMQWVCHKGVEIQNPDKVGGSSFDWSHSSRVSCLKFHNTGNPQMGHTLSQSARRSSLFLSRPAAVAKLPHINGYYWLSWRNYPETSLLLSRLSPACSQPCTQGQ